MSAIFLHCRKSAVCLTEKTSRTDFRTNTIDGSAPKEKYLTQKKQKQKINKNKKYFPFNGGFPFLTVKLMLSCAVRGGK